MKWPGTLSIKQIALGFITGLMVLVSLIGGFAAYQTRAVTRSLELHDENAAYAELKAAAQRLLSQAEKQAASLADWDETRQQLVLPEYYSYWRDQRVYESGMLSGRYVRAALYTTAGLPLGPAPANVHLPARLPFRLPLKAPTSWLAGESGGPVLYRVFPIFIEARQPTPLGYGLIRLEFMPALRHQTFQFTDVASVALTLKPGETLRADALPARLTFRALPDPDRLRFQTILSRTLLAFLVLLLATALIGFVAYSRLLVRPLRRLSADIDAMQQGRFSPDHIRAQGMRISELENVRRSLYDYQLQLRALHGSLESQNREFHSQARRDALTGCHNRRAYEEDWESFREEVRKTPQDVAYLLFDCDRFKAINDTYGHAKGDRVLTIIASALVMALRANDRLYRLGGDEFATFLSRATPAQAKQIAQRCQNLLDAAAFSDLGINEPVGISIGIAFCGADALNQVDELPKQADIAMYTAKQPGRNRIAVYGEDTERASQTLVASRETSALFQALAAPGMIEMHYQSVHALPGRQVAYYEALARIRYHGDLIMPSAFLPVVNSRRLEAEFDRAVLRQVDADLASQQLAPGVGLSINLSAQSISHPEVVSQLLELSRHNARHPLMLEITETSLITQMVEVSTYLDLLRTVRYRIAMDDFGTGYSPLRYLVDLPVDVVKFDISLVNKLAQDNRAGRVVADFARMMIDAGYSLVAEGVESDAILEKVEALGIAHVQGYLLSRPLPLAEAAARLAGQDTGAPCTA
ncbi:putative bifunctional diguanylate cyclase/phosphodiesterase [Thiobacillus sedimenti]|uniref:EAL domain-containing protein n=1 Tax=Thiobacillus sedimenti TaxID=3110231 RepID=A0ABZ1CF74_9PROT|nr:EAL domain-containing protein [Thiobacillus sp. SCUT-2]WRS38019.1 EAL domain-containing protein [Thiobacillus sp. SCUT-2]